ncbi:MAG: hypothetical protein J4F35_03405 [Candidatus Latescibacteria bacterium]|nr:hypothetical protein [Candidatus Latescibacterota bacterium]
MKIKVLAYYGLLWLIMAYSQANMMQLTENKGVGLLWLIHGQYDATD